MITTAQLLADQGFFAGIRPIHLERLSYYAHRAPFRADVQIFREGGRADRFWVVREGLVHLHAHTPDRGEVLVETLGPGAVLGWSWMFPPYTWHFSARSIEPTLTWEFDGPGVLKLGESVPELGYDLTRRFMAIVVERLQASRARLIDAYSQA